MIRLSHGYFQGGGGVQTLPQLLPTIDAHIACWHVLIGEKMEEIKCKQVGILGGDKWDKMHDYRVRKLTERECFKLMGVKQEDFEKLRKNQSKSSCYHLAGDSIVTTVLMAIFGQMFDINWKAKINEMVEEIIK